MAKPKVRVKADPDTMEFHLAAGGKGRVATLNRDEVLALINDLALVLRAKVTDNGRSI